jgi:hypothetical protein
MLGYFIWPEIGWFSHDGFEISDVQCTDLGTPFGYKFGSYLVETDPSIPAYGGQRLHMIDDVALARALGGAGGPGIGAIA